MDGKNETSCIRYAEQRLAYFVAAASRAAGGNRHSELTDRGGPPSVSSWSRPMEPVLLPAGCGESLMLDRQPCRRGAPG